VSGVIKLGDRIQVQVGLNSDMSVISMFHLRIKLIQNLKHHQLEGFILVVLQISVTKREYRATVAFPIHGLVAMGGWLLEREEHRTAIASAP
jgi:hypothetical protein